MFKLIIGILFILTNIWLVSFITHVYAGEWFVFPTIISSLFTCFITIIALSGDTGDSFYEEEISNPSKDL